MRLGLVWVGVICLAPASGIVACSEAPVCYPLVIQSDTSCAVSADCVEAGFPGLTCVDGACRVPCTTDSDCSLRATSSDSDEAQEQLGWPEECRVGPQAICEAQVCIPACLSDADCGNGESCLRLPADANNQPGRCGLFRESFEIPRGASGIDFDSIGWTLAEPESLVNPRLRVAWKGIAGCDNPDPTLCGGPAAAGVRFALIEALPTPPKGTPNSAPTCGACACCLECLLDPPTLADAVAPVCSSRCEAERQGNPNVSCGIISPAPFEECPASNPGCRGQPVCPATVPGRCQSVCTACEACPAQTAEVGDGLSSCERDAANKGCTACPLCDACTEQQCPVCLMSGMGAACETCLATNCLPRTECRDCYACSELADCILGGQSCPEAKQTCEAQGNAGCYPTPVNYPRAQLTEAEQSLTSAPLPMVAGAAGELTLEFSYVPFNVGRTYAVGVQNQAPPLWPRVEQELLVQFCAANCEVESSFTTAQFADGRPVSLPPPNQRGNGLQVGTQSELDWRSGKIRVPIPENFRTPTFRVRFVPHFGEGVRLGLDEVIIRRRG